MMHKPIHQHWGQDNLDDQKQNDSGNVAISLIQMNLQLSALSVEMWDIIIGHAPMLHHDRSLSYKFMFSFSYFSLISFFLFKICLIVDMDLLLLQHCIALFSIVCGGLICLVHFGCSHIFSSVWFC